MFHWRVMTKCCTRPEWRNWWRCTRTLQLDEVFFIQIDPKPIPKLVPQFFPRLLAGQKSFFAWYFKFTYFQKAFFSNCHVSFRDNSCIGLGGLVGADAKRKFPSYFPRKKTTFCPSKMIINRYCFPFEMVPFSRGHSLIFRGCIISLMSHWWVFPCEGFRP